MGVKVLSLFDGMSCGMLAMQRAGVEVDEYTAYEIDKYAIQTVTHNFPMIKECGDVFKADFAQYKDVDYLIGGSPCTHWSIAQKNNRETEARGVGWELFTQYVRALREAKPKYFIYENNKSMSSVIRDSITKTFGFEPICINSALVSAQNRQRLYWVGMRNSDGTYSKVDVKQPDDRGILLKDILESNCVYKETYELTHSCNYNVAEGGTLRVAYTDASEAQGYRVYSPENKSVALRAQGNGRGAELIAAPIAVNTTCDGKGQCLRATCYKDGIRNMVANTVDRRTCVAEPVNTTDACKAQTLKAQYSKDSVANFCCGCAEPCEWDTNGDPIKAVSIADGKVYTVYAVKDGHITIKGEKYPIKLADGFYIIRKFTVTECKRLQTVPEWYKFPVSTTQAYKMLGNGWTVDVIAHLVEATLSASV